MIYFCCEDERRRNAVRDHPTLNGIDFLEVKDDPSDPNDERQRTLFVHFIKNLAPGSLTASNIRIEGGERIRNIGVIKATVGATASPPSSPPGDQSKILTVEVSEAGDFSTYTLRLVRDESAASPPASFNFDPILSSVDFSFKVACPSDFDCLPERVCPPEQSKPPEIDYLAKDYASFRQLMLDRMALIAPQWTERNPADIGIVLVELLAYVGDYLSYQQDAVATESYLGTARLRTSVRRHARLVDYPMHDGRNARVWVQIQVSDDGDGLILRKKDEEDKPRDRTKLLTDVGGLPVEPFISRSSAAFQQALLKRPQVFELKLARDLTLLKKHNEIKFYTWGARECCLPKGATKATLDGDFSTLKSGDVLVLVENRGPETGAPEDADPAHRHAVRLSSVRLSSDPLGGQFKTTPDNNPVPVTEIEWLSDDALSFALCLSSLVNIGDETTFYDDVGLALGNVVLADHGMTFTDEPKSLLFDLDEITTSLLPDRVPSPNPALTRVTPSTSDRCEDAEVEQTPARYRPRLTKGPITQSAPYPNSPDISASATFNLPIEEAEQLPVPSITLKDTTRPGDVWEPKRDLLASNSTDKHFVVEVETDGTAYLRFGNDRLGMRPAADVKFLATYRIGNGTAGNVGAESIKYLVSSDPSFTPGQIVRVWNPLPASGGLEAETIEHVRQNAPAAFRRQERAVTPADYEEILTRKSVAQRCGLDIQHATATLRWTGSWYTIFLTADRRGGEQTDKEAEKDFEKRLRQCIERYRMAGQDLEVDSPSFVSLEIEMVVCVKLGYFFSDVKKALLEIFSNRTLPDGRRGIFHPDNFTFGQPVYLSPIIATAQSVAGVDSVTVTKFQRQGKESNEALLSGKLELGRLEIARLDNDPNFRERGVFTLKRG